MYGLVLCLVGAVVISAVLPLFVFRLVGIPFRVQLRSLRDNQLFEAWFRKWKGMKSNSVGQ